MMFKPLGDIAAEIVAKVHQQQMAKEMTDIIEINTNIIARTDRMIAVGTNGDDAVWLPLAQIDWQEIEPGSDEIVVALPRSLAQKRGLA